MNTLPLKISSKTDVLRPFALTTENPWIRLQYRPDPADPWKSVIPSAFVVLPPNREDLRTEVQHSFDIEVDLGAIRADGIDPDEVRLVVLARDAFAKRVVTFFNEQLGDRSSRIVNVSRPELETTSLAARIDFHIMLVAATELRVQNRRIRKGGRLADHLVVVSSEQRGHTFNFARTSGAQFLAKGLPESTLFHLEARGVDLIEPCDDVSSVLTVLVHEDAWSTLQEIRAGDRAGEAFGAMFLVEVILGVLSLAREPLRQGSGDVDGGSVVGRLLSWVADGSSEVTEGLVSRLKDDEGFAFASAHVQRKLNVTASIHKVRLEERNSQ